MKIDANDPKWTAYALGEITDEQERAEIESILEKSAEMRELVEDIRQTAGFLKRELQAEPAIHLTQAQRNRIEKKTTAGKNWFKLRPAWAIACAAAAVMLISFVIVRQLRQSEPLRQPLTSITPSKPAPVPVQGNEAVPAPAPKTEKPIASATQNASRAAKNLAKSDKPGTMNILAQANPAPGKSADIPSSTTQPPPVSQPGTANAVLSGTITDASKAVLPGATVTATNIETGIAKRALSNAAGLYSFAGVQAGKYKISAELSGFQTQTYTDFDITPPAQICLNFTLPVRRLEQSVEVSVHPENLMLQSSSSAGVSGANLDLQRDGVTVNDVRWATGLNSPVDIDPSKIGGFKMALAPVDAELARGPGQGSGMGAGSGGVIGMASPPPRPYYQGHWPPPWQRQYNTEAYDHILDNAFLDVAQNPLSTFSIDVDTASYSNVRRFLDSGRRPPRDAVRIEELVNYFDYDYKAPKDAKPFAANFEIAEAPWNPSHRLLRIALKGREVQPGKRPNSNLVFLLDVSGSMGDANKLPLVKQSMGMLVDHLTESDRVAIVVYSTDTRLHLSSTSGDQKEKLRRAIDYLQAGGTTNGAAGIQLAYQTAKENFIKGGVNRVILATDGDFNVGITNRGDLTRLIEEEAQSGIYLSALGFGMGNLKDATLELLANKGHGNYAYIDTLQEAQKVLVEQMDATLVAIAKDVKIQVEFNPRHVSAYRLIGYEDRIMAKEDFNDDARQAGVIGAGHAVTALYELVPSGISGSTPGVDPLKYQKQPQPTPSAHSDELATVKVRSKEPEKDTSVMSEFAVKESEAKFSNASPDFKFAASVAAFGMVLRDSPYKGTADLVRAMEWAVAGKGNDVRGYRAEFIRLIHRAMMLAF